MQRVINNSICPQMLYDKAYGFSVPKLQPDRSIPNLKKIKGLTWTAVFTMAGKEEQLSQLLNEHGIKTYCPIMISGKIKHSKKPFFSGVVFAALSQDTLRWVEGQFIVKEVMKLEDKEAKEAFFADLLFMRMAEQISRFYPFSTVKKIPEIYNTSVTIIPISIGEYGDCRLISNDEDETAEMYFSFKSLNHILKFDLTLYQFRSLLLSKILINE